VNNFQVQILKETLIDYNGSNSKTNLLQQTALGKIARVVLQAKNSPPTNIGNWHAVILETKKQNATPES